MDQKLTKSIVWPAVCFALTLVVFTTLLVAGIVPPRVFAILCLAAMIIAGISVSRVLRTKSLLSVPEDERPRISNRKRGFVLAGALVWLVLAFWLTRGEPWLPRLVGAAVVVAFVSPFALSRRK